MPFATGKIDKISLDYDYCFVSLDTGGVYHLWSYFVQDDDAKSRVTHGQFLAIARDAINNGHDCIIYYPSSSSIIDGIEIAP